MENVDAETEVSVHAEVYLYGGEETVTATPEEVAYLKYVLSKKSVKPQSSFT